jgi:hypothetical protein
MGPKTRVTITTTTIKSAQPNASNFSECIGAWAEFLLQIPIVTEGILTVAGFYAQIDAIVDLIRLPGTLRDGFFDCSLAAVRDSLFGPLFTSAARTTAGSDPELAPIGVK